MMSEITAPGLPPYHPAMPLSSALVRWRWFGDVITERCARAVTERSCAACRGPGPYFNGTFRMGSAGDSRSNG